MSQERVRGALPARALQNSAVIALVMASFTALGAMLRWVAAVTVHRGQGLDPSDESYYLAWAKAPSTSVYRQSNFGFYLHLVLDVAGGSVAAFRMAGIALVLLVSAIAGWALSRWAPSDTSLRDRRLLAGVASIAVGATSCTYYSLWLVTPGYNLLTLLFGLVTFAGLLAGLGPGRFEPGVVLARRRRAAFAVAGLGLFVLADTKATAALVIGPLVIAICVVVFGWRRLASPLMAMAIGGVIGALIDVGIAGSPAVSVRGLLRFRRVSELLQAWPSGVVWETDFVWHTVVPWLVVYGASIAIVAVSWHWVRSPLVRLASMVVLMLMISVALWSDRARGGTDAFALSGGWWWLRMTAWALLCVTAIAPRRSRALAVGPLVSLGALGLAVGSNNGVFRQSALAAGVYALGVLLQMIVVASERAGFDLMRLAPGLIFVAACALASFGQVDQALATPYRLQGRISDNRSKVVVGSFGELEVTDNMSAYIRGLQEIERLIPGEAQKCLVDLSGGTPVAALILSARSGVTPWLIGGYPGSAAVADYATDLASCTSGPVLLIQVAEGPLGIPLPHALAGRAIHELGRVRFTGYIEQLQVISVLEPMP